MKIIKRNHKDEVVWEYDGELIRREKNFVIVEALFNRDDLPFQGIVLKRNDRFVETFYADKWFNIFEIYDRDDGNLKGWYCNITKPAEISETEVVYSDLILDLWVDVEGNQVVLDEDELNELNLDENLQKKIYASLDEVKKYFESKNPPH
jgi:predicted RNA-binding protein associated with RNAse of E/G family